MSDYFNLNEGVGKVNKDIPQLKFKFNRNILFPALILLAIPFTVIGSLIVREYRSKAAVGDIVRVDINPGTVESKIGGKNTPLSALAYDSSGNPITSGVSYQWSMSSVNSVGTLSRTSGDIAEFIPLNAGCGEITVIAIANGITITKATSVSVANALGVSNCSIPTPTSTPTPTSVPTFTPTPSPSTAVNRVFVTSTFYDGNLGGLSGADAKCQARADAVNLGGTWKAWLSDSNTSADSRLVHSGNPYKLLNGLVLANNWQDFIDGTSYSIYITELNQSVSLTGVKSYAWTNTLSNGSIKYNDNSKTCNEWVSNSSSLYGAMGFVNTGLWSDYSLYTCDVRARLYCIEQSPVPTDTPIPTPTDIPVTPVPTLIPGDYDGSGAVDIGDFNLWKDEFLGNSSTNKSDVNNDGRIDLIDYIYWRNNYQL